MSLSEAATRLVDGPEESRCTARTIERRLYDVCTGTNCSIIHKMIYCTTHAHTNCSIEYKIID